VFEGHHQRPTQISLQLFLVQGTAAASSACKSLQMPACGVPTNARFAMGRGTSGHVISGQGGILSTPCFQRLDFFNKPPSAPGCRAEGSSIGRGRFPCRDAAMVCLLVDAWTPPPNILLPPSPAISLSVFRTKLAKRRPSGKDASRFANVSQTGSCALILFFWHLVQPHKFSETRFGLSGTASRATQGVKELVAQHML